jgi:hypothetical protein
VHAKAFFMILPFITGHPAALIWTWSLAGFKEFLGFSVL